MKTAPRNFYVNRFLHQIGLQTTAGFTSGICVSLVGFYCCVDKLLSNCNVCGGDEKVCLSLVLLVGLEIVLN
jgi:hypothetical protein